MIQMTYANRYLILIFIAASFAILGVSHLVVGSQLFMEKPGILSFGLTFDITLTIPILYYWMSRKGKLPKALLIPIFILTLIAASLILPRDYHQFLDLIKKAIFPIEAFITSFIIFKITRIVKEYKRLKPKNNLGFLRITKECIIKTIGDRKISEILATEISSFYYGLFAWKRLKQTGENTFTVHKKSNYGSIIGTLAFLSFLEAVVFHIVLIQLSNIAAWIIFGLNLYGITFFLADFNAARREPIHIDDESLYINVGIRWRATIPIKEIQSVELSSISYQGDKKTLMALTILGSPNLMIELGRTHKAEGPYGICKSFDRVILNLDEPQRFKQLFINTLKKR